MIQLNSKADILSKTYYIKLQHNLDPAKANLSTFFFVKPVVYDRGISVLAATKGSAQRPVISGRFVMCHVSQYTSFLLCLCKNNLDPYETLNLSLTPVKIKIEGISHIEPVLRNPSQSKAKLKAG